MKFNFALGCLLSLCLIGCIGTDFIDDPIVDKKLEISAPTSSILIGQSINFEVVYYNEYGIQSTVPYSWNSSSPTIASINDNGTLMGISPGQTSITAQSNGIVSNEFLITVVANESDVSQVIVMTTKNTIEIGESLTFTATAYNYNNQEISGSTPVWTSSNTSVASITSSGVLTGHMIGNVEIIATVDGIQSMPTSIQVGGLARTATLSGIGSYNAEGMATLSFNEDGDLILSLSDDFNASIALGTFIYLANSTDGQTVKSSGLDLGEVTSGGAKSFNVTALDADADLETYQYVVVLCKPAGITFGFGTFN